MPLRGEERSAALRLASLPAMTAARLAVLLRSGRPSEIERLILSDGWRHQATSMVRLLLEGPSEPGRRSTRRPRLGEVAAGCSLHALWKEHLDRSTADLDESAVASTSQPMDVVMFGDDDYPSQLAADPAAPALLFVRGSLACLADRRVGIVGTRHPTAYGRSVAHSFGRALSDSGVCVVSGLARGIDASAHRGALDGDDRTGHRGRPAAVVASGLDVVYPPEHQSLWERVATCGLLLSESPPGSAPLAFKFPLRNRIIAALSEVLVVVESKVDGGSMITVRQALRRGVTVMAVPGSTSTPASEGTNLLLRDGALVALSPDDVLTALALDTRRQLPFADLRPVPVGVDAEILSLFDSEPVTLDDVVVRDAARFGLGQVAVSLGRLQAHGWISCTEGWFERIDRPLGRVGP